MTLWTPAMPPQSPHSPQTILLTGATGRLGRLLTQELIKTGHRLRILTRDPLAAHALFGDAVSIKRGDLSDPESLPRAVEGISRMFLLSPIAEDMATQQTNLLRAAAKAGVQRVVKLSGSDWTIGASASGNAHALIEERGTELFPEFVAIRPNAWAQVALAPTLRHLSEGGPLLIRHGEAPVSYIDIRDIVDVAHHQLLAAKARQKPLVITGPQALTAIEIADLASRLLARPVTIGPPPPLPSSDTFEGRVIAQFSALIAAGAASSVSPTTERLLRRPARSLATYFTKTLAPELLTA